MSGFKGGDLQDALAWLDGLSPAEAHDAAGESMNWQGPEARTGVAQRYLAAWNLLALQASSRVCSTLELAQYEAFMRCPQDRARYVITGRPLMPDQAKEVIFATDTLFTRFIDPGVSEDPGWNAWALGQLGYDYLEQRLKIDGTVEGWRDHNRVLISLFEVAAALDTLDLKHLSNAWASGIGWCRPWGEIHGVGDLGEPVRFWEIVHELSELTRRFAVLDLWLTILDGENPIVTLHANGGDYSPEDHFCSGLGEMTFYEGSLEPHGAVSLVDKSPGVRYMPDDWVVERGKVVAPTILRLVPPRRPPSYLSRKGWR